MIKIWKELWEFFSLFENIVVFSINCVIFYSILSIFTSRSIENFSFSWIKITHFSTIYYRWTMNILVYFHDPVCEKKKLLIFQFYKFWKKARDQIFHKKHIQEPKISFFQHFNTNILHLSTLITIDWNLQMVLFLN